MRSGDAPRRSEEEGVVIAVSGARSRGARGAALGAAAELAERDAPRGSFPDDAGSSVGDPVEDRLGRTVVGADLGYGLSHHLRDVGVAAGGHRNPVPDRELLGLPVRSPGEQPGLLYTSRASALANCSSVM